MPIMERNFTDIVEDCLFRLDRGELLLEVLGSYPSLEGRLRPLLLIAMLSRALPQPAPKTAAIRKGKNLMLAEMNLIQAEKASRIPKSREPAPEVVGGWLNPFQPDRVGGLQLGYRLAIVAVVLLMGGGLLTLDASASGLPGGFLDNLFAGIEKVRTVLLHNGAGSEELTFDGELTSLDDDLAGNPGDLSTIPGYDPSAYTDRIIPGLEGSDLPTVGKNPPIVDDDPYEDLRDLKLEDGDEDEAEDEEVKEEKDKDEKIKKDKKDKDKIKKDKDKDK